MPWNKDGYKTPAREADAYCLGGCGFKLPLYTMAVLRPDQRNHSRHGMCKPCGDREYHRSVREARRIDATV